MQPVKIYTPDDYRTYRMLSSLKDLFISIRKYKSLIKWLTIVGLTQQYKKSFLGVSWLIISPVISILLWVLLQSSGLFHPGDTKIPYVAYVLLSQAIWGFFISFYKSISETFTGRGSELLQNNFPHIIIVIEKIIISTVNFLIPFLLSLVVLMYYNVSFTVTALLFPLALIPLMCLGTGLGLLFSVLKIVAVDFTTLFDNSLELLKYITPVVFAYTVNNITLQTIMSYNPLTYLINFPRSILLGQGFPDFELFIICSAGALLFLLFSFRFFTVSSPVVFEKITL